MKEMTEEAGGNPLYAGSAIEILCLKDQGKIL